MDEGIGLDLIKDLNKSDFAEDETSINSGTVYGDEFIYWEYRSPAIAGISYMDEYNIKKIKDVVLKKHLEYISVQLYILHWRDLDNKEFLRGVRYGYVFNYDALKKVIDKKKLSQFTEQMKYEYLSYSQISYDYDSSVSKSKKTIIVNDLVVKKGMSSLRKVGNRQYKTATSKYLSQLYPGIEIYIDGELSVPRDKVKHLTFAMFRYKYDTYIIVTAIRTIKSKDGDVEENIPLTKGLAYKGRFTPPLMDTIQEELIYYASNRRTTATTEFKKLPKVFKNKNLTAELTRGLLRYEKVLNIIRYWSKDKNTSDNELYSQYIQFMIYHYVRMGESQSSFDGDTLNELASALKKYNGIIYPIYDEQVYMIWQTKSMKPIGGILLLFHKLNRVLLITNRATIYVFAINWDADKIEFDSDGINKMYLRCRDILSTLKLEELDLQTVLLEKNPENNQLWTIGDFYGKGYVYADRIIANEVQYIKTIQYDKNDIQLFFGDQSRRKKAKSASTQKQIIANNKKIATLSNRIKTKQTQINKYKKQLKKAENDLVKLQGTKQELEIKNRTLFINTSIDEHCYICNKPASIACSKCKAAFYCSENCLKKDWFDDHKFSCDGK